MRKIIDITSDASQEHTVTLEDNELVLSLRFLSVVACWFMDVDYKGKKITGVKVSNSTLHMDAKGYPFDFYCVDNSGFKLDPYKLDDFESARCSLYILDPADMEEIRGVAVEF